MPRFDAAELNAAFLVNKAKHLKSFGYDRKFLTFVEKFRL